MLTPYYEGYLDCVADMDAGTPLDEVTCPFRQPGPARFCYHTGRYDAACDRAAELELRLQDLA